MAKHENIQLTSAELAALHQNYLGDTMSICVFGHFLETVVDPEIKIVVEHAFDIAVQHVEDIKEIFIKENIPVPIGFTEQDVNKHAPRLFSDAFYLSYIKQWLEGAWLFMVSFSPMYSEVMFYLFILNVYSQQLS
ncbi:DUF3231 family protein [Bacillus sp. ISL-41]|uniref:DUF3231 family protein n=1 Tax=Bacillus sp. ISL-41 TaxID=2819127 RepID=UPI003335424A